MSYILEKLNVSLIEFGADDRTCKEPLRRNSERKNLTNLAFVASVKYFGLDCHLLFAKLNASLIEFGADDRT